MNKYQTFVLFFTYSFFVKISVKGFYQRVMLKEEYKKFFNICVKTENTKNKW